jgi:hypothetical protein
MMDDPLIVRNLTLVARQLLIGLDDILRTIALLEGLPAARCEVEAHARFKIEGILNLLHVRLARAERAAQHVLPGVADSGRAR